MSLVLQPVDMRLQEYLSIFNTVLRDHYFGHTIISKDSKKMDFIA